MNFLVVDDDVLLRRALAGLQAAIYLEADDSNSLAQGVLDPDVSSLVIGPRAADPLSVAQRMARIDQQLAILIVPERDSQSRIRQERLFTPFLGDDVRILGEQEARSLHAEVEEACQRTLARRHHRTKLRATIEPERKIWRPEAGSVLDTLLDQAPIGLAVLDANRRIRAWNRHLELLTGVTTAQIVGQHPREVFQPAAIRPLMQLILDLESHGPAREIQLKRNPSDAEPLCLVISSCALQGDPPSAGSLVMIQDVSDRVRAERQRLEMERHHADAQRLESLGILSGGIAHDFNNILVAILGNAELGLLEAESIHAVATRFEQIIKATRQASELTRQMLAYAGRTAIQAEIRDLNEIISDTCALLRASVSKNASMQLVLHEAGLPVELDVPQIRQVLMNLVTNASDAIGEDQGEVHISTALCYLETSRKAHHSGVDLRAGSYAQLEVRDTGCGMDEETQRRIFEPFFTTKNVGRGLGLSSVVGIVKSHHGELRVESGLGSGTCFTLLLPLAEPIQPSRAKQRGESLSLAEAGRRVLVVDDEPGVREFAESALRCLGYEVETAVDGASGLRKLLAGVRVDAVLLDSSMPGLTGEQFMRELETRNIRVPTVLCSGYVDLDDRLRGEFANLCGVLEKPYALHDLAECLRDAFESEAKP